MKIYYEKKNYMYIIHLNVNSEKKLWALNNIYNIFFYQTVLAYAILKIYNQSLFNYLMFREKMFNNCLIIIIHSYPSRF